MDLKSCPVCGVSFAPKHGQIYCHDRCRSTAHKRRQRAERERAGLCPQCGKVMDYPAGTYKAQLSYCSVCQAKFRKNPKRGPDVF